MKIRYAEQSDLKSVTDMYNLATEKLMEQEIHQWFYPWTGEMCQEFLGELLLLESEGRIIGGMVLTERTAVEISELYDTVFYLEKIVIHPLYQGNQLIDYLFHYAKQQGKAHRKHVYFDCWAGNQKLRKYYSKKAEYAGTIAEKDYEIALFCL